LVQPVVLVDHAFAQERHDRQARAEDERASLGKEQAQRDQRPSAGAQGDQRGVAASTAGQAYPPAWSDRWARRARSQSRGRGGASQATISSPAATNSSATSAPVTAVTPPISSEMAHRRRSVRLVRRASLTAASTMTAGATPYNSAWTTGRPWSCT